MNLFRRLLQYLRSSLAAIATGVTGIMAMATVFCAYGGYFDPSVAPVAALALMVLPFALAGSIFILVIDLIFWRKASILILVAWIVSLPPILVFSPVNFSGTGSANINNDSTFTLLTYNVIHFWDIRSQDHDYGENPTLKYILDTDADIVNLQEIAPIDLNPDNPNTRAAKITRSQVDSLYSRYPYRFFLPKISGIFSKYPVIVEQLPLTTDSMPNVSLLRLTIHGHEVSLYNVHLKSIGLSDDDKQFYMDLYKTPPDERIIKQEIKEAKTKLISKLSAAFRDRTREARFLRDCIDLTDGPVIVAGDFNDVPGCYAVRTIMNGDLHDAYADAAFGPTITYHQNRFYFRIDQILYRGPEIISVSRGSCDASDHYPMLATFRWNRPNLK